MANKKSKLLLVVFIIFIMITSVIGYFSYNNQNQANNINIIDYNGFKFQTTQEGRWITSKNNINFIFDKLPSELENINLPNFQITQDKVYVLYNASNFNPGNDYSVGKLYYTLQNLGIRAVFACINEENCPTQYPIKDCSNEAFYFKLENTTKVYKDNKCLVIQGNNIGMSSIVDKINLRLLGII